MSSPTTSGMNAVWEALKYHHVPSLLIFTLLVLLPYNPPLATPVNIEQLDNPVGRTPHVKYYYKIFG